MNHILAKSGILFLTCYLVDFAVPYTRHYDERIFGLVVLALAIAMLIYSDPIANWLSAKYSGNGHKINLSLTVAFRLPIIVAGLFGFVRSLSSLKFIFDYVGGIRESLKPNPVDLLGLIALLWAIYLICGAPNLVSWQVCKTQKFLNEKKT